MKQAVRLGLQGLAIMLGLVAVLFLTFAAFGQDPVFGVRTIFLGAFGDAQGISRTLVRATPLLLAGLGVVVAWRAGMYNIGGEGQYVLGGIGGAMIAKLLAGAAPAALGPMILICGVLFGASVAALAAWLQVKRGVQVVVSTILMNFLALELMEYLLRGPLQERKKQLFVTDTLPNEAMLMRFGAQTDLHFGIVIALISAIGVAIYLYLTKAGLQLRIVGDNPSAARANKIPADAVQIRAMAISGGLCGLAGAVDYAGLTGRLADGFSQNWGFIAIPVALMGALNPIATIFSATYFGALFAGSEELKRTLPIGNTVVPLVQGVVVLAYIGFVTWMSRRKPVVGAEE